MKCLIIGGTGTISGGIAVEAIRRQYEVTVLNRGTNKSRNPDGAEVLHCDINDSVAMEQLLSNKYFDVIVDPITYSAAQLSKRVLLFENHCNLYVFISSCAAIGAGNGVLDEASSARPIWNYGVNKLQCEMFLRSNKRSFDYIIIRPSITYGDIRIPIPVACRENPWTVINRIENGRPLVCFKYTGDSETKHNLMNIEDFSVYAVELFDKTTARDNDYIICSDYLYSWNQAYTSLYRALNKEQNVYEIDKEKFKFINPALYDDIIYDKDAHNVSYSNAKVKHDTEICVEEKLLDDGISSLVAYLRTNYSDRPLEEEYNYMTDALLLFGVANKDVYLKDYISNWSREYKRKLYFWWYKKTIKNVVKSFIK